MFSSENCWEVNEWENSGTLNIRQVRILEIVPQNHGIFGPDIPCFNPRCNTQGVIQKPSCEPISCEALDEKKPMSWNGSRMGRGWFTPFTRVSCHADASQSCRSWRWSCLGTSWPEAWTSVVICSWWRGSEAWTSSPLGSHLMKMPTVLTVFFSPKPRSEVLLN